MFIVPFQESSKSLDSILGLKTLARNMKKITSNSQESSDETRKISSPATSKYVSIIIIELYIITIQHFYFSIYYISGSRRCRYFKIASGAA